MKKKYFNYGNSYIFFSFIIILFTINFLNFFEDGYGEKSFLSELNVKNDKSANFIAHAGGGVNNKTYTNSIQAFENSINNGFRLIEFDFLLTKDQQIIGSHDWDSFEQLCKNFINISKNYSYSDFKKCNENLELKLIDHVYLKKRLDQFNNRSNKSLIYIFTDQIQDFKALKKIFSGYETNFVIEAHSIFNYFNAKRYFPYVALTFNDGRRYKYVTKFLNVNLIIIKSNLVSKYSDFLKGYIKKNKIAITHTSNNADFINLNLDETVSIFYTDFWDFNNDKCTQKIIDAANESPCHTY